jgi:hypothetical protein
MKSFHALNDRRLRWFTLFVAMLLCSNNELKAMEHPIPVITADVFVTQKRITMRVQVYADQIPWIEGIEPDDKGIFDSEEFREAMIDHGQYVIEHVQILNAEGVPFKGRLTESLFYQINEGFSDPAENTTEMVEVEFPENGIEEGRLMGFKVGYEFEYQLSEPPSILTFRNDVVKEFVLPSELQVWLKQSGTDQVYKMNVRAERPQTLRLDWVNPPLSDEDSTEEWEKWFELQQIKSLGISDFSSVLSFIYITRREVRHEIVIPLATLSDLIDFEREDELFLSVEEQEAARKKVQAYFSIGNPVEIDGIKVQPVFDRIDFTGPNLRDLAMRVPPSKVSMVNGRVGVIMSYGTKSTPKTVSVTWDKFGSMINNIDVAVIAFDEVKKSRFSRFLDDNTFDWVNPNDPQYKPINEINASLKQPTVHVSLWSTIFAAAGAVLLLVAVIRSLFGGKHTFADSAFAINAGLIIASMMCAGGSLLTVSTSKIAIDNPFATPELDNSDATTIFDAIHGNIFRAFDYHSDAEIYDALEKSVHGELLSDLYLKIQASLKMQEQGGAVSNIDTVQIIDGKMVGDLEQVGDSLQFQYACQWDIIGTVEHWGHIHRRTNKYEATFTVQKIDDHWKITGMELDKPIVGKVETDLRRFN